VVVEHGRKFLAAHDELAEALRRAESASPSVRLGMPNEFAPMLAPGLVGLAHAGETPFAFEITCEQSETLIDRVRARELDMALAMTALRAADSVAHWTMPLSWIAAPGVAFDDGPIRLVTPPEGTLFYNIAADALARAGRPFEIVCKSGNPDVLRSAVDAGYGVSVAPVSLAPKGSRRLPNARLAPLPDVTLGLYACEGDATDGPLLTRMIDMLQASPAFATD
jgi:DNA-binding transcriptional LysR family regulator